MKARVFLSGAILALAAAVAAPLSAAQGMFNGAQPPTSRPANGLPPILQNVDFRPKLDAPIPLDAEFHDEAGRTARLKQFFDGKPVILAFVYYQCPMLCTQVEQGVASVLKAVSFDPGKEFSVVFLSFNPKETPQLASEKKKFVLDFYHREDTDAGWHFLTGEESQIRQVASAAGFRYALDPETGLYAHASGILLLTPDGKISRYFYGIEYSPRDVRLGLVEASQGRIGTPVDHILLFCYHYDPSTGRYSTTILGAIRLGGILTLVGLGIFVMVHLRRDARAARLAGKGAS